mgnify:CR=1 FL=1
MKKKETCKRVELIVRVLLEVKIHERRQEDDEKEEAFFDISCIACNYIC